MKTMRILFISLLWVLFGCVPSLHELYTKQTLIHDPAILGQWQQHDDDYRWEFRPDKDGLAYILTITEKGQLQSKLIAHLVDIDGRRFFDLFPADDAQIEAGDWLKMHLVAAHLFLRVEQEEPTLKLSLMNPETVDKLLDDNPELVKHERIGDRIVLTDIPPRLQKFLTAGLKIENFFGDPIILERVVALVPTEADDSD